MIACNDKVPTRDLSGSQTKLCVLEAGDPTVRLLSLTHLDGESWHEAGEHTRNQ